MIYKQKDEQPTQTLLTINELDKYTEFPVVITKDEKLGYMCVYEVEEFDIEGLSVEVNEAGGRTLIMGSLLEEG